MTFIGLSAQAVIGRMRAAREAADREAAQTTYGPDAFVATIEEDFAARAAYCQFSCGNLAEFEIFFSVLREWLDEEDAIVAEYEDAGVHEPPATIRFGRSEMVAAAVRNLRSLVSLAERGAAI